MPWIVGMENYRAGFNGTATEEQIEITDAVAWAKDKLNFEAGAAQAQILAAGVTQGILNWSRHLGKSTTSAIKGRASRLLQLGKCRPRRQPEPSPKRGISQKTLKTPECSIQLPNGSRIIGLPESEASRMSDDLYHALRPVLAVSRGSLWLMSTPNGNLPRMVQRQRLGPYPGHSGAVPTHPSAFLAGERATLSEHMYE